MKRLSTRNVLYPVLFLIIIALITTACESVYFSANNPSSEAPDSQTREEPAPNSSQTSDPDSSTRGNPISAQDTPIGNIKPEVLQVTLSAVGDIMMHMPQTRAAAMIDGKRNYNYFFEPVKPFIESADIAIANLELTVSDQGPYTGYPRFKAPVEILDALQYAGFDVLVTANNHSMDSFEKGVIRTLDLIDERKLIPVGTSRTPEEDRPNVVEKNGIRLGLAAYTYGTNGIPLPKGKPYMVNLIDKEEMREDIAYLDQKGVDFKIVALHFGLEYQRTPSDQQKDIVHFLHSLGVDLIIGSHPHVLQPVEWIRGQNGHETLVIYSLGNFISNQQKLHTDSGLIFLCTLEKNINTHQKSIRDIQGIPTAVIRTSNEGKLGYEVVPVSDILAQEAFVDARGKRQPYYLSMWEDVTAMFGELLQLK